MKTGKRIFSMILVFALVLTMLPAVTFAANTGFNHDGNNAGSYTVSYNNGLYTVTAAEGYVLNSVSAQFDEDGSPSKYQWGNWQTYLPVNGVVTFMRPVVSETLSFFDNFYVVTTAIPGKTNTTTTVTGTQTQLEEGKSYTFSATVAGAPENGSIVIFTMPDGSKVNAYTVNGVAQADWTVPMNFYQNGILAAGQVSAQFLGTDTLNASNGQLAVTLKTRTLSNAQAKIEVTGLTGTLQTQTTYTGLTVTGVQDMQGNTLTEDTHYTVTWQKSVNGGVTWVTASNTNVMFVDMDTIYKAIVSPVAPYTFGEFELSIAAEALYTTTSSGFSIVGKNGSEVLYEGQPATLSVSVIAVGGTVRFYEDQTFIGEAYVVDNQAVLKLTDAMMNRTLTAGTHTYRAVYSGVDGRYAGSSAELSKEVLSGTLPTTGWDILIRNVTDSEEGTHTTLAETDIGDQITLSIQLPNGVAATDYTVEWFGSTDGEHYVLLDSHVQTVTVVPMNNLYRYYAVVYPSDIGNFYRPVNGISIEPVIFGDAKNTTRVEMTTATPMPYEHTKMTVNVSVWDTLNNTSILDDIPVKGGTVTLRLGGQDLETLPVDASGMATFTVDVPAAGDVYTYTAAYSGNAVYYTSSDSTFDFQDGTTKIEVEPEKEVFVDIGDIFARSNVIVWMPIDEDSVENTITIRDNSGKTVTSMTSGEKYTLTAPDVYTEFFYKDAAGKVITAYVELAENVDFYYEWQISEDSGNTWTTKGNRDKTLTDVIADDDVLYKVRAIPTQNYKEPTGGLDSKTTEKAARIEGKLLISVRTGLTEGFVDYDEAQGEDEFAFADTYEGNAVTIRATLYNYSDEGFNIFKEPNFDDPFAAPTGYVRFYYIPMGNQDADSFEIDPLGDNWIPILDENGSANIKIQASDDLSETYAAVTTSELPVEADGRMQNVLIVAEYYGDNTYMVCDSILDLSEGGDAVSTYITLAPVVRVWSSVPYVNLSTEDLVDENPVGIVITAPEATRDPENGETIPVFDDGALVQTDPDDLGNLYGDGSLQSIELTTPIYTRDGYYNYVLSKTTEGATSALLQVGNGGNSDIGPESRLDSKDVNPLAILNADEHYDIYWEYCPDYKAELVKTNEDGVIGAAIDSAAGDGNTWMAIEGSTNWHTIYVTPEYASYAFRARIVVRNTDATKAAFNGDDAVKHSIIHEVADQKDENACQVLYGNVTTKSAARTTYYSNVLLVNFGENAAHTALEAVISPASSGAKGGDTVTIDAFVYGGSTSANPEGYAELYVDTFEEDKWVKIDELEGAEFTVSDRDDDYRQALVNGEAVWNLQNVQPGIYSFKIVYQNADGTLASEKYIYNYIVRDDTYEIALNPVEEIYDGESHAAEIVVTDYSEDGTSNGVMNVGDWTWKYYEYTQDNNDEYIDLVQLVLDNIVYYYYELGENGYAAEPAAVAPVDHGDYKVDAVLLDTLALTRRSVSADSAVKVLKRAVYLETVTYQTEIYDPTNLSERAVNVLYTELNQAPVTSKVANADTGFYTYGTNGTLPSQEADVSYDSGISNPGTGIPAREGSNAIGVVAGDTVFARVLSAAVAEGEYAAGTNRTVAIVATLDGADAENYYLVQKGTTEGAMIDDGTETYTNFPIDIYRNQVYAGWTGTDADSFAAVDESGTTSPVMEVEVYYHGEGKIALVGTGVWTERAGFSALTEADQWDDENGNTLVPADLTRDGLYTIVVRPKDAANYKGGASTKFVVTTDANGNVTRTYTKTIEELAAPTLFDIKDTQQIYDGAAKTVTVSLTNPAYTADDVAIEYTFDGAVVASGNDAGRYGVAVSVADKNGVTLDSPYATAGILTVYRGEYDYDAPVVSDKTYDGEPVVVANASAYPNGTYFTFSGGRIKGVSYDAPVDAGKYVVTAHIPNTHNYAETTVSATFVIEKKTVRAQVMNAYNERFTTIAKADILWDGFVEGDSSFSDILILPSFAQVSRYPTHVGQYDLTAVEVSFGKEVDADRDAFADELLDYTAYAYNYVIDTVDGTNSIIGNGERVAFEILGLNGHGTIHYGDVIDLWTIGNTANSWVGGSAKTITDSAIIRWSVTPADDFVGTVLIDAITGRLYVAGVGSFTVTAYRGTGNEMIYATATATAEKYVADVVVDQEDYVYDGTAKRVSTLEDRVHIGFLDEMTVTLTQMTEVSKENPNPEFYEKTVTLFNAKDTYIYNYSMTSAVINKMAAEGLITAEQQGEYLAKYTAPDWKNVGDYIVTVYINPVNGMFYEGYGSNRLTIHESYKDVIPTDVNIAYGTGYLKGTQGVGYTHTVDSTLDELSGLTASGNEVLTLDDAWVYGDVNRRADAGIYTSFVAGGTESNDAVMNDSNYIYHYVNGSIAVSAARGTVFNLGFSKQDGTGFVNSLNRAYGDDTYVVDYQYGTALVTGDSLADFALSPDLAYVTVQNAVAAGSKLYERTLPSTGSVVLDSTDYTGVSNLENLILSNAENHAERDDNDIYTVEANKTTGESAAAIAANHYGEQIADAYNLAFRAKNLGAENYLENDGFVQYETASLNVSQRTVALKAWRASIPYGASFKDAYDLLISCYEIDEANAANEGLAYEHEIADLELQFYTMIGGEKVYLTEEFLAAWYESENVDKNYTFIPEIGNTNYALAAVTYVDEPDGAKDPDIEVDVTKTQIWGKVTWRAGVYPAYRYTDNFNVTFYKSVYDEATGEWVETNERVVLNDDTVEYTIRRYAEDGKGEILVEGILTNPSSGSYTYSSGKYDQIFEQVQVFFKANGYNLISVK